MNNDGNLDEFTEDDLLAIEKFHGKTIFGNININQLTYDEYLFLITDIEKDRNNQELKRITNFVKLLIFPYNKQKEAIRYNPEIAAYVEDGDYFNCIASQISGRKSMVLKSDEHSFVVNARWVKDDFLSNANTMSDMAENREVSSKKNEIRPMDGKFYCINKIEKELEIFVMPLSLENLGLYAPILVVLVNRNTNDVIVGSTKNFFAYKNINLAARWYEDEFICYTL